MKTIANKIIAAPIMLVNEGISLNKINAKKVIIGSLMKSIGARKEAFVNENALVITLIAIAPNIP